MRHNFHYLQLTQLRTYLKMYIFSNRPHHSFQIPTKVSRFSQLLLTKEAVPKENLENKSTCKSFKLFLRHGLISSSSPGIYSFLPLTMISLEKLSFLVEIIMKNIGGQKISMPILTHSSIWKTSGRWDSPNSHLFKLKDRNCAEYCLGPTHEEVVTKIISDNLVSLKTLPLKLFQISTKFRDELRPKLGLLRGREFLMKDMYTFDSTQEDAISTYNEVCQAYDKLFDFLGVKWIKAKGSSEGMGGTESQEYHFLSDIGEDEILYCSNCKAGINKEVSEMNATNCPTCMSPYEKHDTIEVGHAFLLGTTYSELFNALYKDQDGNNNPLQMGCFGLGLSRILAASIECLATKLEQIRWPLSIAPYIISVIPPKRGSKEEIKGAGTFVEFLVESLRSISSLRDAVIIDDRTQMTIGKRVQQANELGIPYVLVSGGSVIQDIPKIEVIDIYHEKKMFMTHSELMTFFQNIDIMMMNKINTLCDL